MGWNVDRTAIKLLNLKSWSVRTRRVFALTFPVSIPLWIVAILCVSLIQATRLVAAPLQSFWNDEPARLSNGYYDYSSRRSKPGEVVRLKDERSQRKRAA